MTSNRPVRKEDLEIVMLGDSPVGKTCLVLRYINRQFQDTMKTLGADHFPKSWGHYKIAIWDTTGGARYTSMSTFCYRNASAAILAFDLTDRKTFESLSETYIPILNSKNSIKLKVIVGTKWDILPSKQREVDAEEGKKLARKLNPHIDLSSNVPYFETSSKIGANVDLMFEYVFGFFYPNRGSEPRPISSENNISLSSSNTIGNESSCF